MLIGEFGNTFNDTSKLEFFHKNSFYDYDYLIVDLDYIFRDYKDNARIFGNDLQEFCNEIQHEIKSYLKSKDTFIVFFVPKILSIAYYSITSNRPFEIKNFISYDLSIVNSKGRSIDIVENTPFTFFLNKYKKHFYYNGYIVKDYGISLAKISTTNRTVCAINERTIIIPKISGLECQDESEFLWDLNECFKNSKKKEKTIIVPQWTCGYLLHKEKEINTSLIEIESQLELLEIKKDQLEFEKKQIENKKLLFSGTGINLEDEIKSILIELGFKLLDTDLFRDDIIASYNGNVLIMEIKGVTGSAAEKQAAQLEKWISEYRLNYENNPKGILLVNTYKDKFLEKRTEPNFPHQMINFSEKRDHCLITGLQFLGLYYECINHPLKKDEIIETLFTNIGIYKGYEDWESYIQISKTV